jgi:hypothetical protein
MEILQTIALLCQLNGAGADSMFLILRTQEIQVQCQKYYITCLANNNLSTYKDLSKCVQARKL